jgi:hypothetical protein
VTMEEAKDVVKHLGAYFLYWKGGGGSVAAVGMTSHGDLWYYPTNWVSSGSTDWSRVERVELITTQASELFKRGMGPRPDPQHDSW